MALHWHGARRADEPAVGAAADGVGARQLWAGRGLSPLLDQRARQPRPAARRAQGTYRLHTQGKGELYLNGMPKAGWATFPSEMKAIFNWLKYPEYAPTELPSLLALQSR